MRLADLLFGRPKTRVAAVYSSRESAVAAAEAAKSEGGTDGGHIRVVGPLEQLIGNEPASPMRGAWAVIAEPDTYEQSSCIARALRHPWRRRQGDRARQPASAQPQSKNPAAAGLVTDRS